MVQGWDDVNLYWWNAQKTTFLRLRFSYTAATMYVSHFSSFSHGLCSCSTTTEIDYENEIVFLYFLISSSLAYFMQKMEKTTTSGCLYIGDRAKHFHNPQLSIYVFCKKGAQNQHVNHLLDDYCSARGKSANGTRYLNWHLLSAIQLRNSFPNWQNDWCKLSVAKCSLKNVWGGWKEK